jgi:hypothetical protein
LSNFRAIFSTIGAVLCFSFLGCSTPEIQQVVPSISQVSPQTIPVGASSVVMQVTGANFTDQAVILWNGVQLATSMVNANTLAASIQGGSLTTPGTANVQVQIPQTGESSQAVPVTIAPLYVTLPSALAITTGILPSGVSGTAYSQSIAATGGTPALTWSITSGSLPAGVTLAPSTGTLSGTPTASGTFSFSVTVTDSGSPRQSATVSLTLSVVPSQVSPLLIGSATLPGATVNQTYSGGFGAIGGAAPYTWSIASGSLPAGLVLAPNTGAISGIPTASSAYSFTVAVTDSGSPRQTSTAPAAIAVVPMNLSIATWLPPLGTQGVAYAYAMQASGGTPAYTWSISSGSLPAGLTLAATTGVISGTPSASGTWPFTAKVTDNGNPAQTQSIAMSITLAAASPPPLGPGSTWYVRPDGGTRYSGNVTSGQCDGLADAPYLGSGANQHCAFNDFRYLWDDNSGAVGHGAWVIAGGDTVIVRGCKALPGQQNPSDPNCRIGWDKSTGSGADSSWCYAVGSYDCYNPPIPAGTAAQHTRILGQNYASCNTGGATNPKLYESSLTQIFGGFSLVAAFNLESTQYVDIQCIELTSHNGVCTLAGSPSYPRSCNTSQPLDDYVQNGFLTNNATSNVTFQDVYVHGFNASGFEGPIGGPIAMTRVFSGFNAFAGWNFDDGHDTPDGPGSSINANYVTMIGNGCYEQYPIVNAFPAQACYDTNDQGFGDSWSGQDTTLVSFTCNHCLQMYNTKDGFIGPHTQPTTLLIENSASIGNMGQQWKWGGAANSSTTFINNLTVGNCNRMSQQIPGAAQNFNQSTGLPGSYLTGYCRAAGDVFGISSGANSTFLVANSTVIATSATIFDLACRVPGTCGATPFTFVNDIFLGYTDPDVPDVNGSSPGLYYPEDSSVVPVSANNVEFGVRNGDCPTGGTGIVCADPLLQNEPSQSWISETALDCYSLAPSTSCFYPVSGSPAIFAGGVYSALPSTDYFGTATTSPPVIGAVQP